MSDDNKVSGSSRIRAYLLETSYTDEGFTAPELAAKLPGVSHGSVTGFLSKASKHGAVRKIGQRDNHTVWEVSNKNTMLELPVKQKAGAGSRFGHRSSGRGPLPANVLQNCNTPSSVSDRLLQLASECENLRPLADYSTDELLAEIKRRTR